MAIRPRVSERVPLVDTVLDSQTGLGESHGGKKRIDVQTHWVIGRRTPAWNDLWRRILAEVLQGPERAISDAIEEPGIE